MNTLCVFCTQFPAPTSQIRKSMITSGIRRYDSRASVQSLPPNNTIKASSSSVVWTFVPEPESKSNSRRAQRRKASTLVIKSPRSVDQLPIGKPGKRIISTSQIRFTDDEISILHASQHKKEDNPNEEYDTRLGAARAEHRSIVEMRSLVEDEEEDEQPRRFRVMPEMSPVMSVRGSCLFEFDMTPPHSQLEPDEAAVTVEEVVPMEATRTAISADVSEKVREQQLQDSVRANKFVTSGGEIVEVVPPGRKRLLRRIRPRGEQNESTLPGPSEKSREMAALLRETEIAKKYKRYLKQRNIRTPKNLFGE